MSSVKVFNNQELNIENITFSDPKPSGHGGQTIYINYVDENGKKHKQCLIQTPWLWNPFGLNQSPEQEGEEPKYYVELSFGSTPTAYVEDFHAKMKQFDTLVGAQATENCRTWLSRADVDDEYLAEFQKKIVRPYKNKDKEETGEYPDTLRFKVPYYNNGEEGISFSDLEVYDADKNRIHLEDIDDLRAALGKGNRVRVIAQAHSVWQTDNEFGVSWRLKRIQMVGGEQDSTECAFIGVDTGIVEAGNSDEEEEFE